QHEANRSDPREDRSGEPFVAGDIDETDLPAGGERRPCEPEVDREAAAFLLRQAIGIDPGESQDQRGLPVVDVAGRSHDVEPGAHSCSSAYRMARASRSSSSGGTVSRSNTIAASSTRQKTAGRPWRSRAATRSADADGITSSADERAWPGSEPPPAATSLGRADAFLNADARPRARSNSAVGFVASIRQIGISVRRPVAYRRSTLSSAA